MDVNSCSYQGGVDPKLMHDETSNRTIENTKKVAIFSIVIKIQIIYIVSNGLIHPSTEFIRLWGSYSKLYCTANCCLTLYNFLFLIFYTVKSSLQDLQNHRL